MSCFDNSAEDRDKSRGIPDWDEEDEKNQCFLCGALIDSEDEVECGKEYYHASCLEEERSFEDETEEALEGGIDD